MPSRSIRSLRADLGAVAVPADAGPMAAYMKHGFAFLGVRTPARRRVSNQLLRATDDLPVTAVVDLVDECWAQPEREFQYVGSDLVARQAARLTPDQLGRLHGWITTKSWWDTVDALAAHGVGTLTRAYPECAARMERWVVDDDIWVARAALLHQLRWKDATDEDQLFRFVAARAGESEFFLRKGAGWALREYAKVAPDSVRRFVAEHEAELSTLTRREALKNIGA